MGLFDQWNTKTLGGSNKLSKSDFDLIQDGVHVQEINKDALELVNLVGQATNTQSQSGPIGGTQHVYAHSYTDGALAEIFAPGIDEVYQLVAIQNTFRTGQSAIRFLITDSSGGSNIHCEIIDSTDEGNQLLPGSPIYIGYPCVLSQDPTGGSSGTGYTYYSVIRVR